MGQIVTILFIIGIWIISFVESSGWAVSLHLSEKIDLLILVLSISFFLFSPTTRQDIPHTLFGLIITAFIIIPLIMADSWQGADYLVSFLIVYLTSQGKITDKVIKYSGLCIAGAGIGILLIYSRGSLLSGWNDNAISMTGLFSFLYFTIFLISTKGKKKFWFWNIVSLIYVNLLFETDCRSGMLFSIISIVGIIFDAKIKKLFRKKWITMLWLNMPLIIAYLVIAISQHTDIVNALDEWSMREFGKSIFNGRDMLWGQSLGLWERSGCMGTGKFLLNYHNSGLAALSVFGILGYICWISYFNINVRHMRSYLKDNIVFASLLAFCLIFLQQSVDLGFISDTPNLLPYMILGIGLGRIRLLKAEESNINPTLIPNKYGQRHSSHIQYRRVSP